ncbi:MAG: ShlB/FhaC/HecB family hemolysin secretion/activation protein, partial [Comamonas sp.]|nr:ShlB/FhaC/HecB family hemolysin secretion/activation protein [Comamonas sp.]
AIEGATLLPAEALDTLIAPLIGQALTLAELEHTAQRIAEHYRQNGWFARVYLPQQDVTEGRIRIQVLEGRFGGSSVQQTGSRANAAYVQSLITARLSSGAPLSSADLERGLLLANDLPGIAATGVLQAGANTSETALAIQVRDTAFITGDAGLNNYGIPSTGRLQASGGLAVNNWSGQGDQFSLRLLAAQDIRSAVARYSLPLGYNGLRLTAHASTLDYTLGGSYRALQAEGKAHTAGLRLHYPLVRQARHNLNLSASYEHRRYDDDILSQALRRHRIHSLSVGLNGDWRDDLGGGGITWGSLSLTSGQRCRPRCGHRPQQRPLQQAGLEPDPPAKPARAGHKLATASQPIRSMGEHQPSQQRAHDPGRLQPSTRLPRQRSQRRPGAAAPA